MSDDENNPENPIDEGEKNDSGDKRNKDKNAEPSNNNQKEKNKNGG